MQHLWNRLLAATATLALLTTAASAITVVDDTVVTTQMGQSWVTIEPEAGEGIYHVCIPAFLGRDSDTISEEIDELLDGDGGMGECYDTFVALNLDAGNAMYQVDDGEYRLYLNQAYIGLRPLVATSSSEQALLELLDERLFAAQAAGVTPDVEALRTEFAGLVELAQEAAQQAELSAEAAALSASLAGLAAMAANQNAAEADSAATTAETAAATAEQAEADAATAQRAAAANAILARTAAAAANTANQSAEGAAAIATTAEVNAVEAATAAETAEANATAEAILAQTAAIAANTANQSAEGAAAIATTAEANAVEAATAAEAAVGTIAEFDQDGNITGLTPELQREIDAALDEQLPWWLRLLVMVAIALALGAMLFASLNWRRTSAIEPRVNVLEGNVVALQGRFERTITKILSGPYRTLLPKDIRELPADASFDYHVKVDGVLMTFPMQVAGTSATDETLVTIPHVLTGAADKVGVKKLHRSLCDHIEKHGVPDAITASNTPVSNAT